MTTRLNQIELISAIAEEIDRQSPGFRAPVKLLQAIVEAANSIVAVAGEDRIDSVAGGGLSRWLSSDDTGMSSLFLASKLAPEQVSEQEYAIPHDPSDFGRCIKLLEAEPALRDRLAIMRSVSNQWSQLVERWDEIERLLCEEAPDWSNGNGRAPKTYALIQEIVNL